MATAPKKTGEKRLTPEFMAQAGKGRPKGTLNKTTTAIKDMILGALDRAGGEEYLLKQADSNPTAFLNLVAKVLPTQLTGEGGGPIQTEDVTQDKQAVAGLLIALASRAQSDRATLQ